MLMVDEDSDSYDADTMIGQTRRVHSKKPVLALVALVMLGAVREILGSGSLFGWKFIQGDGMIVFVLAPGAFIALGYLIVLINKINKKKA